MAELPDWYRSKDGTIVSAAPPCPSPNYWGIFAVGCSGVLLGGILVWCLVRFIGRKIEVKHGFFWWCMWGIAVGFSVALLWHGHESGDSTVALVIWPIAIGIISGAVYLAAQRINQTAV